MRIVVVEDVPMVRERIVEVLLDLSDVVVVGEADSVETALSTIESQQPDAVLLDISLPSMSRITSGVGILKWIRQTYPAMRVVMLSNHAGQAYRQACEAAGAFYFLDKSYDFDKLAFVIAQLAADLVRNPLKTRFKPRQDLGHTGADHGLTNQMDRPTHSARRLVLWLYFLLAAFGYLRVSRKGQTWPRN